MSNKSALADEFIKFCKSQGITFVDEMTGKEIKTVKGGKTYESKNKSR